MVSSPLQGLAMGLPMHHRTNINLTKKVTDTEEKKRKEEEAQAAVKVQSIHRGRMARQHVNELKSPRPGHAHAPQDKHKFDKKVTDTEEKKRKEEEEQAAVKVQSIHRGRMARQQTKELRQEKK